MKSLEFLSEETDQTIRFGNRLARFLKKGDILCLFGDLGSGKTTLTKGVAKGLKVNPNKVHSPTFVLLNEYKGKLPLFHFDFYRVNNHQEIASIGYEEYLYDDGISVIEWAEKLDVLLPQEYIDIQMIHKGEGKRLIKIRPKTLRSREIIGNLSK